MVEWFAATWECTDYKPWGTGSGKLPAIRGNIDVPNPRLRNHGLEVDHDLSTEF